MAQLICDLDKVEIGTYIIGHIEDGGQVVLCDSCLIPWCLTIIDERTAPETKLMVATHLAEAAGYYLAKTPESVAEAPRRRGRTAATAKAAGTSPSPVKAASTSEHG